MNPDATLTEIVNLGKWILRYLFADFIDEELRRDDTYRQTLVSENQLQKRARMEDPQFDSQMPHGDPSTRPQWSDRGSTSPGLAVSSNARALNTPALSIGIASPNIGLGNPAASVGIQFAPIQEGQARLEKSESQQSQPRGGPDPEVDYFNARPQSHGRHVSGESFPETGAPTSSFDTTQSTQINDGTASLTKRLRHPFSAKKLVRTQPAGTTKPLIAEQRAEDSEDCKGDEKTLLESLRGTIKRIRAEYSERAERSDGSISSLITPSLPNETPVLRPPINTTVIIQEERPDTGGVTDLFEGSLTELGKQADLIEEVAPSWLGDVLLRVRLAFRLQWL